VPRCGPADGTVAFEDDPFAPRQRQSLYGTFESLVGIVLSFYRIAPAQQPNQESSRALLVVGERMKVPGYVDARCRKT